MLILILELLCWAYIIISGLGLVRILYTNKLDERIVKANKNFYTKYGFFLTLLYNISQVVVLTGLGYLVDPITMYGMLIVSITSIIVGQYYAGIFSKRHI